MFLVTEVNGGNVLRGLRLRVVEKPAEPAVVPDGGLAAARMPDIHRLEVRAIRIRITNSLNDGQAIVFQQVGQSSCSGMKSVGAVNLQSIVRLDSQCRACLSVGRFCERSHRVQSVIPPRKLDHDENCVVIRFGCGGTSPQQKLRSSGPDRDDRRSAQ